LARAGWAHQGEVVAGRDVEVHPLQHVDPFAAAVVDLVQIANLHQRAGHHCTLTLSPSLSVPGASVTTRSPADTPERTSTSPLVSDPTLMARRSTRSSCTTKTTVRPSSERIAAFGTIVCGGPCACV